MENSESTVKERLKSYLSANNISMAEFGRRIGVSSAYITSMRKSIQPDKVEKIKEEFPDLDIDWLLTGVKSSSPPPSVVDTRPRIVEQYAAAGGNEVLDGVTLAQCEQVPVVPMFPNYTFTMRVTGESMSPFINPGDEVACLKIDEPTFLQGGRIYVLFTSQGVMVKKIYEEDDGIRCVSINESYQDFIIPKSEIYSYNLVIGLVRLCNC